MNIVLIGFMGCGKTTIAMELSKAKDMFFLDTDILIERKLSLPVNIIFDYYGQRYFRIIEKEVISEISEYDNCVISVGGGAFIDSKNIETLKDAGIVIFLKTNLENIMNNIAGKVRPLLKGKGLPYIFELYESRMPYYKKADLEICVDGLTSTEVVKEIINRLEN